MDKLKNAVKKVNGMVKATTRGVRSLVGKWLRSGKKTWDQLGSDDSRESLLSPPSALENERWPPSNFASDLNDRLHEVRAERDIAKPCGGIEGTKDNDPKRGGCGAPGRPKDGKPTPALGEKERKSDEFEDIPLS